MINHMFMLFSTVQTYKISYIHLYAKCNITIAFNFANSYPFLAFEFFYFTHW